MKYSWEVCIFPRAFRNNSLCKIWGANRVHYVELENRELYHQWAEQIILDVKQPFFLTPENFFSKFFLQNYFCHHFTWYHWLRNFPIVFQPIIIQKFWSVICTGITILALVLYFFALCYTWTALLSTNQNTEIFSCILLY